MNDKAFNKKLYKMKNEWLGERYQQVTAREFYRAVFPVGSFERQGHPEDGKPNGVMTIIEDGKAKNYLVFDSLMELELAKGKEFAILSPISYVGRNRTAVNARWLHGVGIDLDGVGMDQIRDLFYQVKNGILPQITYCINSGNGLHLYYLLEKPVPLYTHTHEKLKAFKYELTAKVWNRYTSIYKERDQVQYQGIFQGFRVVGSQSKMGERYPVRAFATGKRVTFEYLSGFLMDKSKAIKTDDLLQYTSRLTLTQAKERYPEWYERRIEQGEERGRWHVKRDLYDWWRKKIIEGASAGHRYHCLAVLATYAIKCDIDEDELVSDALELVPYLDHLSDAEHGNFTQQDALDAMKLYTESYVNYSRSEAERVTAIPMPPNKRNGRKQADHIKLMNYIRDEINGQKNTWRNGNGRKPKEALVRKWREAHPTGRKVDCCRDLGLSRPTVYKWWNLPTPPPTREEQLAALYAKLGGA